MIDEQLVEWSEITSGIELHKVRLVCSAGLKASIIFQESRCLIALELLGSTSGKQNCAHKEHEAKKTIQHNCPPSLFLLCSAIADRRCCKLIQHQPYSSTTLYSTPSWSHIRFVTFNASSFSMRLIGQKFQYPRLLAQL
jgi:hypothetical protein